MRLSKIRIAGFKSFVDPITLDLRSNLVGILGPNGCGKSNVIDAVRWVMGESSAKHLRGQSMDDVIFNGSASRKPVGVASVELVFDNSAGQLGGEYARFTEIAIKRQVSRDGTSKYFLNGSRCRRRDITDIFLGTGLGPRSYAIIEQGMISRLIEAKPEELRHTLEEAAGISRYKDRRRETESRIASTRENLERLTDLRDELDKQLQKLDKQVKAAERYKELRAEQRQLEAQSLYLQRQSLQSEYDHLVAQLKATSERYQAQLNTAQEHEAQITQLRSQYSQANEHVNTIQGDYYQAGAEISRLEQSIQHQKDNEQRQQANLQQVQKALDEALQHAQEDRDTLQHSQQQLAELEPQSTELQAQINQSEEHLFDAEQAAHDWQAHWQQLQQQLAEPTQQAQLEKNRLEQLERQLQQNQERQDKLHQEAQQLSDSQFVADSQALQQELTETRQSQTDTEAQLQQCHSQLQTRQQQLQQLKTSLDQQRSKQQSLQGRLASLETLQQADLGEESTQRQQWLQQQQLDQQPRLAEQLHIEAGWETALETVLATSLDAITVTDLAPLLQASPPDTTLTLLEAPAAHTTPAPPTSLAAKVQAPLSAHHLLTGIYCIDSLQDVLAQRAHLQAHESYITRDGVWLGKYWIHWGGQHDEQQGILQRQQAIRDLQAQLQTLQATINTQQFQHDELLDALAQDETQRQQLQSDSNRLHRSVSELTSRLQTLQQRLDDMAQRRQQVQEELDELQTQAEDDRADLERATAQRNTALHLLEELKQQREQQAEQRETTQQAVNDARQQLRRLQDEHHDLQLRLETQRTQQQNSQQQLERITQRIADLEQQRDQHAAQLNTQDQPIAELQAQLDTQKQQRSAVEERLSEARQQLQRLDKNIHHQDEERLQAERQADTLRTQQEQLKLDCQSVQVRTQSLSEQLAQIDIDLETVAQSLSDDSSVDALQQRLDQLANSIKRLGAINLAAIDEHAELAERKAYLDQQNEDLVTALDTLESAIHKIDKETRTRFKATFEHINQRLGDMFPRLFGGGECYLAMTGDDWLTTGIAIMAKPPGKRISSIHLMSGGEKALTAVALVFAIFELNPAPFCMLDEVDAPLDEANVGRFCELVRHMAERVQFIFITHNKTSMELADNLVGVTMREAGVSRLVAVDVAEAVKLAGV